MTIGIRLKEERVRLMLNQTDFAAIGGVSKKTQIDYEKNATSPVATYMAAIAAAGADVLYILTSKRGLSISGNELASESHSLITSRQRASDSHEMLIYASEGRDASVARSGKSIDRLYNDILGRIEDVDSLVTCEQDCDGFDVRIDEGELAEIKGDIEQLRNAALSGGNDMVMVPRHDVAGSCGGGSVIHSEQIVDHLAFKREWVSKIAVDPSRLALIEAVGDSMISTINPGDLLLVDLTINTVTQNSIYALNIDGDLVVKRIQRKLDGSIIVKSDNENYDPETFTPDTACRLRIVGRVIWMGKRA